MPSLHQLKINYSPKETSAYSFTRKQKDTEPNDLQLIPQF